MRILEKGWEGEEDSVHQDLVSFGEETRETLTFEVKPETLDSIEIRVIGREVNRLEVMSAQTFRFAPTGNVQNQVVGTTCLGGLFLGQSVPEKLKNLHITDIHHQSVQSPGVRLDRANDIESDMTAHKNEGGMALFWSPLPSGTRIIFDPASSQKKTRAWLVFAGNFREWV